MKKVQNTPNIWENFLVSQQEFIENPQQWEKFYYQTLLCFGIWKVNNPEEHFCIDDILSKMIQPKLSDEIQTITKNIGELMEVERTQFLKCEHILTGLEKIEKNYWVPSENH